MTEFPSLAEVLARHQWRGEILGCDCGWDWPEQRTYFCGEDARIAKAHIEHQAEMWRESCTIRTFEQLDALPALAVISSNPEVTGDGNRWTWERFDEGWFTTAFGPAGYPDLPALLIWHPSWEQS